MFLKFVALLLCITYATCDVVNSVQCDNKTIHSENVRMEVSGCTSADDRCKLIQGTNHTVKFTFEPSKDFMDRTNFRVYGVFNDFTVPYGKKEDACKNATTTDDGTMCTDLGGFVADRKYSHHSEFKVSKNYPTVNLTVRFVFEDRRTKDLMVCQELPVKITSPPPSP